MATIEANLKQILLDRAMSSIQPALPAATILPPANFVSSSIANTEDLLSASESVHLFQGSFERATNVTVRREDARLWWDVRRAVSDSLSRSHTMPVPFGQIALGEVLLLAESGSKSHDLIVSAAADSILYFELKQAGSFYFDGWQNQVVQGFLSNHPFLEGLLVEALPHLHSHYKGAQFSLRVEADPEDSNTVDLVVGIRPKGSLHEALVSRSDFEDSWWLDQCDRAKGLLWFHLDV